MTFVSGERDGLLSLAVRTTTSALWQPAAREAIAEHHRARAERRDVDYINEIGAPARAQDFDALLAVGAEHGRRSRTGMGSGSPSTLRNSIRRRRLIRRS